MSQERLETSSVFGMQSKLNLASYVDRGELDQLFKVNLRRSKHVALRGESKCGKSWLRQKCLPSAIVVQCRLHTTVADIYTDVLSQLGIRLIIEVGEKESIKGRIEATAEAGAALIAKLRAKLQLGMSEEESVKGQVVGHDINDLKFIAEIIKESGRRVVVEDFHYLKVDQRKAFAFDLKALWDYQCYFIIIGVWTKSNLLIYLNPDLAGRITEIPVVWQKCELDQILVNGSSRLNIEISSKIRHLIVDDCYNNAGILQLLVLDYLDEEKVYFEQEDLKQLSNVDCFESAAMNLAEQLSSKYLKFAEKVSAGIRSRKQSTKIYAHSMAVIMDASDDELINGYHLNDIFSKSHAREARIQKQNQRTVLSKIEELQVDEDGRGLVLAYNDGTDEVSAIDRTLLFYRKYVTVNWPWEQLIRDADEDIKSSIIIDI